MSAFALIALVYYMAYSYSRGNPCSMRCHFAETIQRGEKFRSVNNRRTRYVQSDRDRSNATDKLFNSMKLNTTRAMAVKILKLGNK